MPFIITYDVLWNYVEKNSDFVGKNKKNRYYHIILQIKQKGKHGEMKTDIQTLKVPGYQLHQ